MKTNRCNRARCTLSGLLIGLLLVCFSGAVFAADSSPQVSLDTAKAMPRSVEALTQRAILRDYKFAWTSLSHALESSSTGPLTGIFDGAASESLQSAVKGEQSSGVTCRYTNQAHKLQAVFYAPEGDLIELHDTAEYDIEISDGGKAIHNEHAVVRYVVLMTPGADRWVIRQLQAVQQF